MFYPLNYREMDSNNGADQAPESKPPRRHSTAAARVFGYIKLSERGQEYSKNAQSGTTLALAQNRLKTASNKPPPPSALATRGYR